ncbi:hypothetical protein [Bacillus bingmayongensis]|uniref:hypothetical protein n=1 Tax=Bacillus bingmayongensis TaxID=1150157 RepID=UPI00030466AA|nr:hypothetical protein [Bacillus bingmayongensis]MBY0597397.1 hypothetical protein [Bacillus bingmayongensis]
MNQNNLVHRIQNLCNKAIEYAKAFDKTFNYSEENIKELEEILDYYTNDLRDKEVSGNEEEIPTENQIYTMALIWGSYLGEVLKRHIAQEAEWIQGKVFNGEEVLHLQVGEWKVFPIDKVYKRFVNGREDNVISFYDITKEYMLK